MASVLTVVLFCLFFQAAVATNMEPCALPTTSNSTMMNSSNIMISPGYYYPNTTYNVTISGLGTGMDVSLSASVDNSSFGYWENNSSACSGILILGNMNVTYKYKWTSPGDMSANVTFKSYVQNATVLYFYYTMLLPRETMNTSTPMTSTMAYNSTGMADNVTTSYNHMTTPYMNNTTPYMNTTTPYMKNTTPSGSASFQPLGAFALTSMVLLFATAKPLLS